MTSAKAHPPLRRQKSEAEILSYHDGDGSDVIVSMSHHIQHLNLIDTNHSRENLGEKFHCSVNSSIGGGGDVDQSNGSLILENKASSTSSTTSKTFSSSPSKPPLPRRASLSTLEESHLSKIGGAFESEIEKARKARRRSFDKISRKRSSGGSEERKRGGEASIS